MTEHRAVRHLNRLSTPRAAALAGVIFAVLFAIALILIRTALPEHAEPGSQWVTSATTRVHVAAVLMPFAGISFLWFIGVVRDGFGRGIAEADADVERELRRSVGWDGFGARHERRAKFEQASDGAAIE